MNENNSREGSSGLIHVSYPLLLLSMVPLLVLGFVSYRLEFGLEYPMVVSAIRSFVQLSILGTILHPLFTLGEELWWLVILYCVFMVILAAMEATSRSKYHFRGMFGYILVSFLISISVIGCFTFVILLQPQPLWDPQYVIPIVGMLIGNCISGVALTVNTITTSFVENTAEIDLFLALGASPLEASLRLVREAVRVGSLPRLNAMAVIGLISIPGMMTGQLLAGAPVVESARYQMLICYLIALTAFGTIICEVWIVQQVAFDKSSQMLREGFFSLQKSSVYARAGKSVLSIVWKSDESSGQRSDQEEGDPERLSLNDDRSLTIPRDDYGAAATASKPSIQLDTVVPQNKNLPQGGSPLLELRNLSRKLVVAGRGREDDDSNILFRGISHSLRQGTIVVVHGPSGAGKSQLLRVVARLLPKFRGELLLQGKALLAATEWRRQVRYVSQTKIDIPGTPKELIQKIPGFQSWRQQRMTFDELYADTLSLVGHLGLDSSCLEKQWKTLSGGESQRIHVSIALATKPKVLLMDESTSALDQRSKISVEKTVVQRATETGMGVLWISHDLEQMERLRSASR